MAIPTNVTDIVFLFRLSHESKILLEKLFDYSEDFVQDLTNTTRFTHKCNSRSNHHDQIISLSFFKVVSLN